MPRVIDYALVLDTMLGAGFESLYHNSGAFGFGRAVVTRSLGWVGPPDPTLRPAAVPLSRVVPPPHGPTLAALAVRAWRELLPGPLWLMPKSHWAFELDHANQAWLPGLLQRLGVDPAPLAFRNDGAAIEFTQGEESLLAFALGELLTKLWGSDYALAWPPRRVVCTVHHHTQLWWTTSDDRLAEALDGMVAPASK